MPATNIESDEVANELTMEEYRASAHDTQSSGCSANPRQGVEARETLPSNMQRTKAQDVPQHTGLGHSTRVFHTIRGTGRDVVVNLIFNHCMSLQSKPSKISMP